LGRPLRAQKRGPKRRAVVAVEQMSLAIASPKLRLAVLITEQIASGGESNWLKGVLLLAVYAVIAIMFYFLPAV